MSIFEGFEDNPEPLTPQEKNLQLVNALMERAQKGEHSKFEFIRSLDEYKATLEFKRAIRKVASKFEKTVGDLYSTYLKSLKSGGYTDPGSVVAIKEMDNIVTFYKEESNIALDMQDEYVAYLKAGHSIEAFMGTYRPECDLKDFRKLNAEG